MKEPVIVPPLGIYNNGDHTEQDWAVQGAGEHMLTEAQAAEALRRVETWEGLKADLDKYGQHLWPCEVNPAPGDCTCGFAAAIAKAEGRA